MTRAAAKAIDTADALLVWLDRQPARRTGASAPVFDFNRPASGEPQMPMPFSQICEAASLAANPPTPSISPRPAHTDWLFHRLAVTGRVDAVEWLRADAVGAGTIPWVFDLEAMEEHFFARLVARDPGSVALGPTPAFLSPAGARLFSHALREAVDRRHALAVSRVGRSQACAFDLHTLLPAPDAVLSRGPDHPIALHWLSTHWGTTQALRHVAANAPIIGNTADGDAPATWRLSFWSADWTPWAALQRLAVKHPALRFDCRPIYDMA